LLALLLLNLLTPKSLLLPAIGLGLEAVPFLTYTLRLAIGRFVAALLADLPSRWVLLVALVAAERRSHSTGQAQGEEERQPRSHEAPSLSDAF
jgi:hypothetical protein